MKNFVPLCLRAYACVCVPACVLTPGSSPVHVSVESTLKAGATPLKAPEKVFWGGYSGYYADPDGHVWEVAQNPFWTLNADGSLTLDAE